MSGGSYGYNYSTVEEEYAGRMYDAEMDALIRDLVPVLKAVEWWQSGDTSDDSYRKAVKKFKTKWLSGDVRMKRLEEIITEQCDNLKTDLMTMIGVEEKDKKEVKSVDYIDEMIAIFEKIKCPKDYKKCPARVAGNDCDNQCVLNEVVDILKDYKELKGGASDSEG